MFYSWFYSPTGSLLYNIEKFKEAEDLYHEALHDILTPGKEVRFLHTDEKLHNAIVKEVRGARVLLKFQFKDIWVRGDEIREVLPEEPTDE